MSDQHERFEAEANMADEPLNSKLIGAALARMGIHLDVSTSANEKRAREAVAELLQDPEKAHEFAGIVSELAGDQDAVSSATALPRGPLRPLKMPRPPGVQYAISENDWPSRSRDFRDGDPASPSNSDKAGVFIAWDSLQEALVSGEHFSTVRFSEDHFYEVAHYLPKNREVTKSYDFDNLVVTAANWLPPARTRGLFDRVVHAVQNKPYQINLVFLNRAENAGVVDLAHENRNWLATYVVDHGVLFIGVNQSSPATVTVGANQDEMKHFSQRIAEAFDGYTQVADSLLKTLPRVVNVEK